MRTLILLSILLVANTMLASDKTAELKSQFEKSNYQKVISLFANEEASLNSEGLYYKALSYIRLNKVGKAELYLDKTVAKGKNDVTTRFQVGNIYLALGKMDKAMDQYRAALRIAPSSLTVRLVLGDAYSSLKQPDSALIHYEYALGLDSTNKKALIGRALAYSNMNDKANAISAYQAALRHLDKGSIQYLQGLYNLANFQYQAGYYKEAVKLLSDYRTYSANDYDVWLLELQSLYAGKEYKMADKMRPDFVRYLKKGIFPKEKTGTGMFMFDNFTWKNNSIAVFELYLPAMKNDKDVKYRFFVSQGQNIISSFALKKVKKDWVLIWQQPGKNLIYTKLPPKIGTSYKVLKDFVVKALNNKIKADKEIK